jgi:hypothetical protein
MIDPRMETIDRLVRIQHSVCVKPIEPPNGPVENRYRLVTSELSPKHSNILDDRISSTTKSGAAIHLTLQPGIYVGSRWKRAKWPSASYFLLIDVETYSLMLLKSRKLSGRRLH